MFRPRCAAIATGTSLGLCVALAGLWVATHSRDQGIIVEHRRGSGADADPCMLAGVGVGRGALTFFRPRDDSMAMEGGPMNRGQKVRIRHVSGSAGYLSAWGGYAGFWCTPVIDGEKVYLRCDVLVVPLYALMLAFAVAPLAWVRRRLARRHRASRGRCVACGYLLTGNTSGLCSECGTPIRRT